MASHVYHEIFLHLNWHTKVSMPLLNPEREEQTHRAILERIRATKGVWSHGSGGTETHIHLAVSIEPSITVSELVRNLKGGSARDINAQVNDKLLEWQRGYGVVSFGKNNLKWVQNYIARQKEHHASEKTVERLEQSSQDELDGGGTDG